MQPFVRDIGDKIYQTPPFTLYQRHPERFFKEDSNEFSSRVQAEKDRVLDAIRYADIPMEGSGLCHELRSPGKSLEDAFKLLIERVDSFDIKAARCGRKPEKPSKALLARQADMFCEDDIPTNYLVGKRNHEAVTEFVRTMRHYIIKVAINELRKAKVLYYEVDPGVWRVQVSAMDEHRLGHKRHRAMKASKKCAVRNGRIGQRVSVAA